MEIGIVFLKREWASVASVVQVNKCEGFGGFGNRERGFQGSRNRGNDKLMTRGLAKGLDSDGSVLSECRRDLKHLNSVRLCVQRWVPEEPWGLQ